MLYRPSDIDWRKWSGKDGDLLYTQNIVYKYIEEIVSKKAYADILAKEKKKKSEGDISTEGLNSSLYFLSELSDKAFSFP